MARPFALVRSADQWSRARHDGTALDPDTGGVELLRLDVEAAGVLPAPPAGPGGLAFDAGCRLYRSIPAEGRVERLLWGALDPSRPVDAQPRAVDFLVGAPGPTGDFEPEAAPPAPLVAPRGLAVDADDRLFVAESGGGRILVYDLWSTRLIRRVNVAPAIPLDLACYERTVWALFAGAAGVARLTARGVPKVLPLRRPANLPAEAEPARIAASPDGALFVLYAEAGGRGWIVPQAAGDAVGPIPHAGDLEFLASDLLVVARRPGEHFVQLRITGAAVIDDDLLKARGYDGGGIVRTPDGEIGFWTDQGFRTAVVARARYVREGRATTYRLDSGEYQTDWGRLFVDACVPRGTEVRVVCMTADEVADEPTIERLPPANAWLELPRPELSPPMPPESLVRLGAEELPVHRRETGRELPWARADERDPFETYEAPVHAGPGRYLWVTLILRGDGRVSPRIKALRAEYPSHDLLRRLPRGFSRDEQVADFLRRYLAMFDGALGDLDDRSSARSTLLDPYAAPEELLPWLASFLGLALDESWPEHRRRQLIDEIPQLWRQRGTVRGLTRFLELYLGREPILVEHFKLRGLGGALLSDEATSLFAGAVVGSNLRVGGSVGTPGSAPLAGETEDAFETHAHRFSVVVPSLLDANRLAAVQHILESQRPAHTVVDVCTVGAGMRVGLGLHVALLSVIGPSGGWQPALVGGARLDRDSIVGRPVSGGHVGVERLGAGTRVG